MGSKFVLGDAEQSLLEITLQSTKEPGVYFVSEPEVKSSNSAKTRFGLEKDLHQHIVKENFLKQFKENNIVKVFNINDVGLLFSICITDF